MNISHATYNVKNLFNTRDITDPTRQRAKSERSLDALAESVDRLDADVITLQELSSKETLEADLLSRRELAEKYPYIGYVKGNSERGINVGIISKFPFTAVTSHKDEEFPLIDGSGTSKFSRDLLQVDVNTDSDPAAEATFFTTHSKSRLPAKPGETDPSVQRISEATAIRGIVQKEMKAFPERLFVVSGDFNDGTEDASLQALLNPKDGGEAYIDTLAGLPKEQRNTWPANPTDMRFPAEQFDHVIIPSSQKDQLISSEPVRYNQSIDSDTKFVSSAASDHLPILSKFVIKD